MKRLSVFDMFKIGVGPSSSHTMGPWQAARRFLAELPADLEPRVAKVTVDLFGSLAKTGKGHGTDIALQLGLSGQDPATIDVATIPAKIQVIAENMRIERRGASPIAFNPSTDIVFHRDQQLPVHPNAMRITAHDDQRAIHQAEYYSVGGGFVVEKDEVHTATDWVLPYPIDTAQDLLRHCSSERLRISEVVMQNELSWRTESEIRDGLAAIRDAMFSSIHRGCQREGVLPGGLEVQRRAPAIARCLLGGDCPASIDELMAAVRAQPREFRTVLDWVSCFALAVNEENASFGRIVTAPTNGAAGVVPAVLCYCTCFCDVPADAFVNFLLTAGEIGCIFKKGATISAALGGCQAEIGVSSSMAAAALTECLGGSQAQATEAAEIAMEHHLGMTCDPVGGLVQIPCIERNAMGAIKAITAAELALARDPAKARVSLDAVVRTMWQTAQDMNAKYKETSEGGLATQIAVNVSEC